jgi:RHS repeat-associated protein
VRQVTDGTGAVTGSQSFDAYGKLTSQSGTGLDRYGDTGREWDAVAGLQYSRARMYDPGVGRWLSTNPLGFTAGDANLYRYVGNGPTNARDPSGLVDSDKASADALGQLGGMIQGTRDQIAQAEAEERERNKPTGDEVIAGPHRDRPRFVSPDDILAGGRPRLDPPVLLDRHRAAGRGTTSKRIFATSAISLGRRSRARSTTRSAVSAGPVAISRSRFRTRSTRPTRNSSVATAAATRRRRRTRSCGSNRGPIW